MSTAVVVTSFEGTREYPFMASCTPGGLVLQVMQEQLRDGMANGAEAASEGNPLCTMALLSFKPTQLSDLCLVLRNLQWSNRIMFTGSQQHTCLRKSCITVPLEGCTVCVVTPQCVLQHRSLFCHAGTASVKHSLNTTTGRTRHSELEPVRNGRYRCSRCPASARLLVEVG